MLHTVSVVVQKHSVKCYFVNTNSTTNFAIQRPHLDYAISHVYVLTRHSVALLYLDGNKCLYNDYVNYRVLNACHIWIEAEFMSNRFGLTVLYQYHKE